MGEHGTPALPKEIHVYPAYNSDTRVNDIAIVELDMDLVSGENVRPVCLPMRFDNRNQAKAYFAGFGASSADRRRPLREKILRLRQERSV
ncbi:hypothetical protein AAVH_38759, partial [Aphelenchoides avenae]